MVSKLVLQINDDKVYDGDINTLLAKNTKLKSILTKCKNKITEHYRTKLWDRYKKLTNEYELIFTTPNIGSISLYSPVSRSFFKMWEILYDFESTLELHAPTMNVMFLAEGPGGFAEAFVKYRSQTHTHDTYHGISLKSVNKNIPEWKYQQKVNICYGQDGTGDLYKLNNLDYLKHNLPKMNIITADGGFDFSSDFNGQEELSLRLILCEIYAALNTQAESGNFILKIYDVFHEYTLKTIMLLKQFYQDIYILKPLSSRPANSEKYLVCTGFRGNDPVVSERLGVLISKYNDTTLAEFFKTISNDVNVLHNIVSNNAYHTLRQVFYIEQTIQYITEFGKNFYDNEIKQKIKQITAEHREKAIKWCEKYNLEHTTLAV